MNELDTFRRGLALMWDAQDPVPEGLVEKVLVAIETEDLDAEYELLHLVERTTELAGARGSAEAVTIAFSGGAFSLLLRVSSLGEKSRRVDGWVNPAQPMKVSISQQSKTWQAVVDMLGRFEIPKLPSGLTRFWLLAEHESGQPGSGGQGEELFATPTFEL